MNHIYNIVFNRARGLYQVVSERTRNKSGGQKRLRLLTNALCIAHKNGASAFPKLRPLVLALLVASLVNVSAYSQSAINFNTDVSTEVSNAAANLKGAINNYAKDPSDANKNALNSRQAEFNTASSALSVYLINTDTVYDSNGGTGGRLEVTDGKFGGFLVASGKKLDLKNNKSGGYINSYAGRGALYIRENAVMVLGAQTEDPQQVAYSFTNNKNTNYSGNASLTVAGSAIFNVGTLMLKNGSFTDNSATSSNSSSAAYAEGGAIFNGTSFSTIPNNSTFVLNNGSFTGNSASSYSTVSATTRGGAIYNKDSFVLNNVTFSNNAAIAAAGSSRAYGGAIFNGGSLVLSNATFSGNSASSSSSSVAYAYGGAIYNNGTIALNVDADKTSLFTGNLTYTAINNTTTIAASSLYMSSGSTLNVNIAEGGWLDMRDPMRGKDSTKFGGSQINISQRGAGGWKLGGQNTFTESEGNKTLFTVNEGTLYLYRADEIENANSTDTDAMVEAGKIQLDGANSSFTLGNNNAHTTLVASGGNEITTDGAIVLNTGDGSHNTTLSFGLAGATAEATPTSANAILNLDATNGLTITKGGRLNIDLQKEALDNNKYTLLYNSSMGDAFFSTTNVNSTLTLNGKPIPYTSRLNTSVLIINDNNLVLAKGDISGIATWTGAASDGVWDLASNNWSLNNEGGTALTDTQFLNDDIVNFKGGSTGGNITINAGGVGTAAIYLSGDKNYIFSNDVSTNTALTTDKDISTLRGNAVSGKLVLGAVATKADTITPTTFKGTLDLTGIKGANNFTGGIDIYGGTLKVAHANQLGTSLSKLGFLSGVSTVSTAAGNLTTAIDAYAQNPNAGNKTTLDSSQSAFDTAFVKGSKAGNIGTLQISGKLVLDGASGNTQRLAVKADQSAYITVDKGQSLTWQNSHNITTNQDSQGGALYIGNEAVVVLGATTTNPEEIAYIFTENSATSSDADAFGGAITNSGTLTLDKGTFTGNKASSSSSSSSPSSAFGGAIYNNSTLILDEGTFTENIAFSSDAVARGGAIYNNSTLILDEGTFTGNKATSSSSSTSPSAASGGGAIYNRGKLILDNGTFAENISSFGGAIYNHSGELTLDKGTFADNEAYSYGGAISNNGKLTLDKGTFTNNKAFYGGAITNSGTLTLDEGTFTGNEAFSFSSNADGGAITNSGTLTLDKGTFTKNSAISATASAHGGAIYNNSDTLTLNDATFAENIATATKASAHGGAIYNNDKLTLNKGTFTENIAFSSDAVAYGGAIANSKELTLSNASFTGNIATSTNAVAYGGAIYNSGTINLNVDAGYTSLFTGNITNNNGTIAASSIYMGYISTLSVNIAQKGFLDMRDPMGGDASQQGHIKISQQGAGVWKLGGDNLFTQNSTGKTTFAVDKGTLYLYRKGEVDNANIHDTGAKVGAGRIQLDGADSSFTLGSNTADTTLVASGGNAITTDGTIVLNTGDGSHNTTLSFGLAGATAEATPTSANAILNLNATNGLTITGKGKLNINLQSLGTSKNDTYTLLYNDSTMGDAFSTTNVNKALTLKGQSTALNSRLDNMILIINDKSLGFTQDHANGLATWTNTTNDDVWDIISSNWGLANENGTALKDTQFLDGDIVNFKDGTGGNIAIKEGGVGTAAIYLSGTEDYIFSGDFNNTALITDHTTTLRGNAASGKLVLGAVATDADTIDTNQTFTGVLDLTGINTKNDFTQGIDIHSGTLKVANADQLGTSLSKLSFLSGNTASNIATLHISGNVVLEGAGGNTQRLAVGANTSAHITVDSGQSLSWLNSHNNKTNQDGQGGALYIGAGAVVVLGAVTADPLEEAYLFSGNTASSSFDAYGGAIYNLGSLVLSNATFSGNSASSSQASGGAIANDGTLTLSNVSFTGNSTISTGDEAYGGALDNYGGTIALNVDAGYTSLFTGNFTDNNSTIAASALYMLQNSTLTVNIAQGGVLDMRDPMEGYATQNNQINISQQGAGVWKLGGDNIFTQNSTGKTTFAVNEGSLYLYRAGEVANANIHDARAMVGAGKIELNGTDSSFTLGNNSAHTTLVASGGNAITTDGTIELNTGDGSHNTTLSFGLTDATAEADPTSAHAILNLNATKGLTITGSGKLNIDLQNLAANNGTYTLLYNDSTGGDFFDTNNVSDHLTLKGQSIDLNSRLNNLVWTINDKSLVLTQYHINGLATWTGAAGDGVWDIISGNWSLTDENGTAIPGTQFISADAVTFNDMGRDQAITVHSGGVTPAGMIVNSGHDYTFSGGTIDVLAGGTLSPILATGHIEKQGQGTLTFNNQVSGAGHIYGGTMIIGESSANHNARLTGNIDVYKGATLGGHGQIAGLVTAQSGATIAPGNSIGTLSVGDIIFQSGSTYEFEGNVDGSGDKIIASSLLGGGTARIDSGANLSILAGAGTWNAATTYSILEADNGVQGQFDHIQTNLAFLTPSLDYSDPNKIGLTLNRNAVGFNHVGRTYNQRNTGLGIQSLSAGHPVYNQLVSMNTEQAQTAFDNLSGEIHASLKSAVLNNSRYTRNAINQHLMQNSGEAPETERNLWVTSWYHKGHLKGDGNAARLDNKGFGIMMGVDALSRGATTLGVALGYEQTEVKLGEGRSSSADMDSTHLLAYGRTKAGPIDIRGAIGYSFLSTESKRHISVGSLIGTNRADYDGSLIQAYIEGSHTFKATNDIDITPYVNLAYQRVKMDRFTESAGLYGFGSQLNHKGGSSSQASSTLGVRAQWRINQISDLYADIGWQHTFGSQTPKSTFNFMGGQPYRIKGVKTNRNAAVLGIGANFQLTPKMQLSFGYEGHLGDQSRDHSAKLQWRLNF